MLENWIYDKNILKKVSKHHNTGKPLPDNMIDSIIETKTMNSAMDAMVSIF